MKYLGALIVIIALILVIVFIGRGNDAVEEELIEDNQEQVEGEGLEGSGSYTLDVEGSEVEWEAGKTLVVDYFDRGTIDAESGTLVIEDGEVVSGEVVIDMTSITATNTPNTERTLGDLEGHLSSDDFFAVETYPTATFTLTSVRETSEENVYDVTGDMTIKGMTESLTFPLMIAMDGDEVNVRGDVVIDRTLFDVRFGSDNFFDNLGNNVIDDEFTLDLDLVFEGAVS